MLWLVGGFLFCPCHLPITLALLGALLAGTVIGAIVEQHVISVAVLTTLIWLVATWYGLRLMNRSRPRTREPGASGPAPAAPAPRRSS